MIWFIFLSSCGNYEKTTLDKECRHIIFFPRFRTAWPEVKATSIYNSLLQGTIHRYFSLFLYLSIIPIFAIAHFKSMYISCFWRDCRTNFHRQCQSSIPINTRLLNAIFSLSLLFKSSFIKSYILSFSNLVLKSYFHLFRSLEQRP